MPSRSSISWRAYPALLAAGCFAVGIALAAFHSGSRLWPWSVGMGGAAMLMLGAEYRAWRRLVSLAPLARTLGAGLLVVSFGGAWYTSSVLLPSDHLAHGVYHGARSEQVVWLEGRVAGAPAPSEENLRFVLSARRCIGPADTSRVSGQVQVTVWKPRYDSTQVVWPSVRQGDLVRVRGRLRPAPRQRNPADFDYGGYLKRRGLYVTLTSDEPESLKRLGREQHLVEWVTSGVRAYVRHHLRRLVAAGSARNVLSALVLGEKHHLDPAVRERFARTGLMHLLAVSGLHVGLVGMVFYLLLGPMLLRLQLPRRMMEGLRAGGTLLILLLYLLLTGARASVVRAVVMAALLMGGVLLQRRTHPMNTLGAAGLVLLLLRPAQLFDAGFQLSFAAVGAIITLNPLFMRGLPVVLRRPGLGRYVGNLVTGSLAATLGTMPILLHHFGRVSFAGLVLNVAAIPLTMLGLAAILVGLALAGWLSFPALVFGTASAWLVNGLLQVAELGEGMFSWAVFDGRVESGWLLGAMVAALGVVAQWSRPRLRWRPALLSLLLATAGLWQGVLRGAYTPDLEVVFFDVGQGDAALMTLPNGRHLLVDAGPRNAFTDQGVRTLVPHLERYGIRRLEAVVVSHAHSDHLGGVPALLRAVPVERVIHNGREHPSALYGEVNHLLDSLNVKRRVVQAGDTLALDPAVRLRVLAPFPEREPRENANAASVVLHATYGRTRFLFTGDIEAATERALVARYGTLLESDVVKVAHHGSRTSSTPVFVGSVLPKEAGKSRVVVSVGRGDRFGMPSPSVLRRWRGHGAEVWTTAKQGAVWLRSNGTQVKRLDWR